MKCNEAMDLEILTLSSWFLGNYMFAMGAKDFCAVTVKLIVKMLCCFPFSCSSKISFWYWAALVDSSLEGRSQHWAGKTAGSVSSPNQKEDALTPWRYRLRRQMSALPLWFCFLSDPFVFQIQMGWFQHDLGHCSVFRKPKWNRLLQIVVINVLKVIASRWEDSLGLIWTEQWLGVSLQSGSITCEESVVQPSIIGG